ncbi:hypothetical protein [Halalkalicoccus jeotgali]|uniref:Uncharacterized protein n=1 Tax=Halalkalicoccus jeotgali (strain DSM 18796 / CECT 7217 / JCM 14584 / KCTC 4019 / B3) TaxID=795797 RepID=D8J332_HALJB|nr:hypothetical protein [Halalkalicoccus jeotgali]ADJ15139.1 hypothetical protein HacjB3_08780 [Halalkalicoccus jeotgali B3]ELY35141.1 hypothetical protein C497_13900 [Halalkalicoccus jeotgali B3]
MSNTLTPVPNPEYVRRLPDLVLVGVVHDHPASVARVETVLGQWAHETLALELPPLALALYRSYASEDRGSGGEMSAAIRASDAPVVGIDGPGAGFARAFRRYVEREEPDSETLERLYESVRTASARAFRCQLAATEPGRRRGIEGDRSFTYECDPAGGIEELAADERSHVSMARAASAFSPPYVGHRDAIREDCMAEALGELPGPVVAVVGIDHLSGLVDRLG